MKKSYKVQSFYLNGKIVFYQFVFHNEIIVNYIGNTFYIIKNINHKCLSQSNIRNILKCFCTKDAITYGSKEYFIRELGNNIKEQNLAKEFRRRRHANNEYISR